MDLINPPPRLTWLGRAVTRLSRWRRGAEGAWEHALNTQNRVLAAGLLQAGIPATRVDSHTAFQALDGDVALLEWALAAGMSPDHQHRNNYFDHLLHRAACRGWVDEVRVLINAGANLEGQCGNHYTPLGAAVSGWGDTTTSAGSRERLAVAELLLAKGADPNAWQNCGRGSLLREAKMDFALIQRLLEAGSNPRTLTNPKPLPPFSADEDNGSLLFRGLETETVEGLSTWLALMAAHGMTAAERTPWGTSFAQEAIKSGATWKYDFPGVLRVLEAHGHDLLASDPDGNSLLHLWAEHQSSVFCEWGDALLALPGMEALAQHRNAAGQTVADVIVARGDWATGDPVVMAYVARFRSTGLTQAWADIPEPAAPTPRRRL